MPFSVDTLAVCLHMDFTTMVLLIEQSLPFLIFDKVEFAIMVVPTPVKFLMQAPRLKPYYWEFQNHEITLLRHFLQYNLDGGSDPYLKSHWNVYVSKLSTTALENNIDVVISCLRKLILYNSNMSQESHLQLQVTVQQCLYEIGRQVSALLLLVSLHLTLNVLV